MAYGLIKCDYGHIASREYSRYVDSYGRFDGQCGTQTCQNRRLRVIANYDPSFVQTTIKVAQPAPFATKILTDNNYSLNGTFSNGNYTVYETTTGSAAVFKSYGYRLKTQELMLFTVVKDPIIKKIADANKADKRERKIATPAKSPSPTKYKDFLGEELTIGDWVACATFNYTNLQTGRIVKINEKSVSLRTAKHSKSISKSSAQIVKLSKERAVLLSLEM
jgi:hypothetical protein